MDWVSYAAGVATLPMIFLVLYLARIITVTDTR